MKVEQVRANLDTLYAQELAKLDLSSKPVACRFWYGENSMNVLVAVPEVVILDDEEYFGYAESGEKQSIDTGLNVHEIVYPERVRYTASDIWPDNDSDEELLLGDDEESDESQDFKDHVIYEYPPHEETLVKYNIDDKGQYTVTVYRFDTLELEECGDMAQTPEDLECFLLGCEFIYGKLNREVINTIVGKFASLIKDGDIVEYAKDTWDLR